MPDLTQTALGQNYRRTQVGTTRFGTRQLQLYEIHIYGLSDAVYDSFYDDSRDITLDDTDGVDQPGIVELKSGTVLEAVLRGVQKMAEIYIVGQPDFYTDPNYNELIITIGVNADTVSSGGEQWNISPFGSNPQLYNPRAESLEDAIGGSVEKWAIDNGTYWDGLDVYPVYLDGDSTSSYGSYALAKTDPTVQAVRDARKAQNAALKVARANSDRPSYTAKNKNPG